MTNPKPTPLSPATQAVDDAARDTKFTRDFPRPIAVPVILRAAANQMEDLIGDTPPPEVCRGRTRCGGIPAAHCR
jgi:hypothetical protein